MKSFYGGTFLNRENLEEVGIFHPIKIEYYKVKDEDVTKENYGVEVVMTEYMKEKPKVEKATVDNVTTDEKKANEILDLLKEGQVSPVHVSDIINDITYSSSIPMM